MPAVFRRARTAGALLAALVAGSATSLHGQIRGSRPRPIEPDYGWWFSGGANAVVLNDVLDGRSNTRWRFGSDPLWQFRGTLEKALDATSTIGIAAGYGVVDVTLSPYKTASPNLSLSMPPVDNPSGVQCVVLGCVAQTQLWTLHGQFRSGGSQRGFSSVIVLSGGVNAFRNFRVKSDGNTLIELEDTRTDLSGALGGGFTYTLSRGTVIELIQDFGIAWHSKEGLADGDGRTYRSRTTRAGLRFKFGGNR